MAACSIGSQTIPEGTYLSSYTIVARILSYSSVDLDAGYHSLLPGLNDSFLTSNLYHVSSR